GMFEDVLTIFLAGGDVPLRDAVIEARSEGPFAIRCEVGSGDRPRVRAGLPLLFARVGSEQANTTYAVAGEDVAIVVRNGQGCYLRLQSTELTEEFAFGVLNPHLLIVAAGGDPLSVVRERDGGTGAGALERHKLCAAGHVPNADCVVHCRG